MTPDTIPTVTCPDCGKSWLRKTGKVPAKGTTWHTCVPDTTPDQPTFSGPMFNFLAVRDRAALTLRSQGHAPHLVSAADWKAACDEARRQLAEEAQCGAVASLKLYGAMFHDPVCHEPAGHSGTHVGIHRDGSRTGFRATVASQSALYDVARQLRGGNRG